MTSLLGIKRFENDVTLIAAPKGSPRATPIYNRLKTLLHEDRNTFSHSRRSY